ncbi:hypothetical protein CDAR_195631 [Caerostris darwini]|uniref:Uncharacterized protein n=1 Tax=Caerostris darwini TaxID=1538125 RepID=A0AAV4Q8I0_9ARAC|nr:hypothetical protein CDAR_195631 [Caerostris darwini]
MTASFAAAEYRCVPELPFRDHAIGTPPATGTRELSSFTSLTVNIVPFKLLSLISPLPNCNLKLYPVGLFPRILFVLTLKSPQSKSVSPYL